MSDDVASVSCAHCGLPVPFFLRQKGSRFCCRACETVYQFLQDTDLDEYYQVRDALAVERQAALEVALPLAEAWENLEQEQIPREDGSCYVCVGVHGMHCSACVWLLSRLPQTSPGVLRSRADLGGERLHLWWDPKKLHLVDIARQVAKLGYQISPDSVVGSEMQKKEERSWWIRMGVSGAVAGNVMWMAIAGYGDSTEVLSHDELALFRIASATIAIPGVLYGAWPFFKAAWQSLKFRRSDLDLPISLGILAGLGWGIWGLFKQDAHNYFDTVTALVFLLLVGRWLQNRAHRRGLRSSELLSSMLPQSVTVIENGVRRETSIRSLKIGNRVALKVGECAPADGILEGEWAEFDFSFLSGESQPKRISQGEEIKAGAMNLSSSVEMTVTQVAADSELGNIAKAIEQGTESRAEIVELVDKISIYFVFAVLFAALVVFLKFIGTDPERAWSSAVAILIVTCPCALGMATPLAMAHTTSQCAKRGIFVKQGSALQALSQRGLTILDKTGTLTEGKPNRTSDFIEPSLPSEFPHWIAALESSSLHPIAAAFGRAYEPKQGPVSNILEEIAGGMTADVELNGKTEVLKVGSAAFVLEKRLRETLAEPFRQYINKEESLGRSLVYASLGDRLVGVFAFEDRLRVGVAKLINSLRESKERILLLSGDTSASVERLAIQLGLKQEEWRAEQKPKQKWDAVQQEAKLGRVAMMGDGVNDAGALAHATVGIAMQGGARVTLSSADVAIQRGGIRSVVALIKASKNCMKTIRRNLVFSLIYNLLTVALAFGGWINPLVAAILMPLSSITVLVSTLMATPFPSEP